MLLFILIIIIYIINKINKIYKLNLYKNFFFNILYFKKKLYLYLIYYIKFIKFLF